MAEHAQPVPVAPGSLEAVLDHAWDSREFTASEAMANTGLTRSTTIDAVDRLIGMGVLRELPNAREAGQYRKGRPSRRFELRSDAGVVVGVDAGRFHVGAAVADLRGDVKALKSVLTDVDRDDPEARRREIERAVAAALTEAGAQRGEVLAICIGVPAAVDSTGVSPPHREGFWQAMNPGLRDLFAEWVPLVRIENDAGLAAVAEGAVGAAASCRDFVALLAGERLGIGVVLGGQILRGAHGAAGEPIALDWVVGVESARGIGLRIAEWAQADVAAGALPQGHPLAVRDPVELTAPVVLDLADAGDRWAMSIAERAGAVLARIGVVLASMYDPERIVVAGAVADGLGRVVQIANRLIPQDLHGPAPTVVASPLGAGVVVTGAVMGALESARRGLLTLTLGRSAAGA